ncbi:type II restriction endonuclease [Kaustia mangrovi]|uniref:Type II restriction endonuclease n=1 Tax=Kaustia mangrovi TaxID=2593653 RepID=A0A7S8C7T5_9HYPH|nr:type II restriction endonuclease [Kaustia mangrovi]QPC45033.1 type II restriction endonuclease [Kaustia mangrovi]
MRQGSLSDHFLGAGVKILRGTEVNPAVSHGHELQGISDFRAFLGSPEGKVRLPVSYVWLSDDEPPQGVDLTGTWYDSRRQQSHREPEYRLYYPAAAEEIVHRAKAGDVLFLCQPTEGPLLALMCSRDSSILHQLLWLFDLKLPDSGYEISQNDLREKRGRSLDLTARYILELIGLEVLPPDEEEWLGRLLKKFGNTFPATREFSAFARNAASDVDAREDPDQALVEWMDLEERLFMTLERHIVGDRLEQGFVKDGQADVDAFVSFSLSVQNRRKSRAGWALGNHTEAILELHGLGYKREATTEKRNGPDFLFPGEEAYHDPDWPENRLTMLGAKTTCKDRWRQVLAEADRISHKHLLTLEPGISLTQTDEMQKSGLQLVLPRPIHETYQPVQLAQLIDMASFLDLVRSRQ